MSVFQTEETSSTLVTRSLSLLIVIIPLNHLLTKLKNLFLSRWVVCKAISDKNSVQLGIRLSYPLYILIVVIGVLLQNPLILSFTAVIAFLGIKLAIHPFDYIYNIIAKLIGADQIFARGSELQVNSIIALIFNLVVLGLIVFAIPINYVVLAMAYTLCSVFFTGRFLFED